MKHTCGDVDCTRLETQLEMLVLPCIPHPSPSLRDVKDYRKSRNFCCQSIFVVVQGYENKFRKDFCTTNN